jgi:hypothetical protein
MKILRYMKQLREIEDVFRSPDGLAPPGLLLFRL